MPNAGQGPRRAGWRRAGLVLLAIGVASGESAGQEPRTIQLTLESAVEMAMDDSYRVRQLRLEIERTRSLLSAQRAGLKSRVYMTFAAPNFERVSEHKWNSTLRRDEIVRENSRMWQMDFSVRQPVVLLGYPTNGYLSLNNRVYRYTQFAQQRDITYYNRYFFRYEQPLFQPNRLRNDLEGAELNLQRSELAFQDDVVDILDDIADDYHQLFRLAYRRQIYTELVTNLEEAAAAARAIGAADSTRSIDANQAQVALANARERVQRARSDFRLSSSRIKQRLGLEEEDSLVVVPRLRVTPIEVDVERAIGYGTTLRPQLRTLDIRKRMDELDLENTRGNNSFRMNLELTYGREMQDPVLQQLWTEPNNSYTVGLQGYIPVWDWGARRARIEAEKLSLQRTELYIEEARRGIRTEIQNVVRNLDEFQQRAMNMEENLELARQVSAMTLGQYRAGRIGMLELLQAVERQSDTADNFLDAYLGYQDALLNLKQLTYYDFESGVPLLERFGLQTRAEAR